MTLEPILKTSISKYLICLSLLTLTKALVTITIVPLWEFPDEQAHFAQVAYSVDIGTKMSDYDLSREIYESERIMGTLRDYKGNNLYTYSPYYKPAYGLGLNGPYESYLNTAPKAWRTQLVKREAARYPRIYYDLVSIGYRLTVNQSLITRVFATRIVSIAISTLTICLMFFLGKFLFKDSKLGFAAALLLSFHPMFSFSSSGINNDVLLNFFSLAIIYLSAEIISNGATRFKIILISILSLIAVYAKPLAFPLLLTLPVPLALEWYNSKRSLLKELLLLAPFLLLGLLGFTVIFAIPFIKTGSVPYVPLTVTTWLNPISYLKSQISLYYRETFVWYWGVFKWLGVILPINLIRIIKIVCIISGIGLVKIIFSKSSLISKIHIVNLISISIIFIASLTAWDYLMISSIGFSHGLQGRYFFPVISAHLILLLVGILSLVPKKYTYPTTTLLVLFMFICHLISLFTLSNAYYDTSSPTVLLNQISQYKPLLLKFPINLLWFSFFGVTLLHTFQLLIRKKKI